MCDRFLSFERRREGSGCTYDHVVAPRAVRDLSAVLDDAPALRVEPPHRAHHREQPRLRQLDARCIRVGDGGGQAELRVGDRRLRISEQILHHDRDPQPGRAVSQDEGHEIRVAAARQQHRRRVARHKTALALALLRRRRQPGHRDADGVYLRGAAALPDQLLPPLAVEQRLVQRHVVLREPKAPVHHPADVGPARIRPVAPAAPAAEWATIRLELPHALLVRELEDERLRPRARRVVGAAQLRDGRAGQPAAVRRQRLDDHALQRLRPRRRAAALAQPGLVHLQRLRRDPGDAG